MPTTSTQSKTLQLKDIQIELIRSRRRTLSLEVDTRGARIRAPKRMALRDIQAFIRSKESWLRKQLAALPEPQDELILQSKAQIDFLGEQMTLRTTPGRGSVTRVDQTIIVPTVSSHLAPQESIRRKLIAWYKQEALRKLQDLVAELRPLMPQPTSTEPDIRVREYRRRWGSCDHKGNLSFNWRLIQAPEAILRYVVIHELAHRTEFNHSRRFWRIVEEFDANWRDHQQWLHQHGASLYRL